MSQLVVNTSSENCCLIQQQATYVLTRNAATATSIIKSDEMHIVSYNIDAIAFQIQRGFLYFDTSSIGSGKIITSAFLTVRIVPDIQYNVDGVHWNLCLTSGMPTYPHEPAVVGDYLYTNYPPIVLGCINSSLMTVNTWNVINLNHLGLLSIDKSGTTKFCVQVHSDINNIAPVRRVGYANADGAKFNSSSASGGIYTPYLTVNYETLTPITYFNMTF